MVAFQAAEDRDAIQLYFGKVVFVVDHLRAHL